MQKILCLVHFHSPVGTTQDEMEEYYQNICRKVLISFHNHQDLKFCLHVSGFFLEWLEGRHPEILMLINDMVKRKQVEIIGGPYYEAALSMIPNSDKLGQIEFLTTYLRKKFGKRPRGGMVPHHIWEPSLASSLKNSGFDYSFISGNVVKSQFPHLEYLPFLTEDQGKSIVIFPVSAELSKQIGHMRPNDMLRSLLEGNGRIYTLYLDTVHFFAEKNIFEDNGWFDEFLNQLSGSHTRIHTRHPGAILGRHPTLERIYIPCTMPFSYDQGEKTEGFFRQKIVSNPVSNNIYGKMIYTYQLVNQIKGDRSRKKTAREELWKGQCNEAYWANGFFDNHIMRKSLYASFMEAEKITREKGIFKPSISSNDMNMDGQDEYLYQSQNLNCYISARHASVYEIDYFPSLWNYGDTFSKENALIATSFNDTVIENAPKNIKDVLQNTSLIEYELENFDRDQKEINFTGRCSISNRKELVVPLVIKKQYQFKKNTVAICYHLQSARSGVSPESALFVTRLSLSFAKEDGFTLKTSDEADYIYVDILDTVNNVHIGLSVKKGSQIIYEDVFSEAKNKNYQYTKIVIVNPLKDLSPINYSIKIEKR